MFFSSDKHYFNITVNHLFCIENVCSFDFIINVHNIYGLPVSNSPPLSLQGFLPGLVGTSHSALQFMTYEGLKRDYNKSRKMPSEALLVRSLEHFSKFFSHAL